MGKQTSGLDEDRILGFSLTWAQGFILYQAQWIGAQLITMNHNPNHQLISTSNETENFQDKLENGSKINWLAIDIANRHLVVCYIAVARMDIINLLLAFVLKII